MKKIILISIIGGVIVIAAIVFFIFRLTADLPDTADNFFKAARNNDYNGAYSLVSNEFRNNTSKEVLIQFMKANKLNNFKQAAWNSREIQNDKGTLKGTVTTSDGTKIPLRISFIKEDKQWKILAITKDGAGVVSMNTNLPDTESLKLLATSSVATLGSAINMNDFTQFYGSISSLWKAETTKEKLAEIFKDFTDKKIDLTMVKDMEPVFDEKPYISDNNTLTLKGYYPTQPNVIYFDLGYLYEDPVWKLGSIHIKVQ